MNGAVYIVESWTETHVKVRLHPDYISNFNLKDLRTETVEETEEDDDDDEENEEDEPEEVVIPDETDRHTFSLTKEAVSRVLRVQHALVYASIQGRTMREKHLGLLDTTHLGFTMRHLIVSLSRATHGKYVHIFNSTQAQKCMELAAAS